MPEGGALVLDLPEKLTPLLEHHRYKVIVGGRGKGATWNIGRALLILGTSRVLRILCAREIQRTIRDSVHALLKDQIALLGLERFYDVKEHDISGANGTRFAFAGLRDLDAEKVKSYEAFDIAWVAEARNISKRSWDILIPTIRKDDSEIWVDLNPEMDSDETYARFVEHTPPDTALMRVSWRDNPWFPKRLQEERETLYRSCQERGNMEDYNNIYEGHCRTSVEGAIYATEIREAIEGKRIRPVPYDAMLKVHTVWDLGFNDSMSIIFVQRLLNQLQIIDYIEDRFRKYDWYVAEIRNRRYNLGKAFLPHDAGHESPLLTKNPVQTLRQLGLECPDPPHVGENVELGIKRVRQTFPRIFFDEVKAQPLVQHLKRYRRTIPSTTNEPQGPLHDEHSHGADALRLLCMVAEQMTNDEKDAPQPIPETGIV